MEPNFKSSKQASGRRKQNAPVETDGYFAIETAKKSELGDPKPVLAFLAQSVIETLAGVRDVDQSARWLSDSVYQQLRQRSLASKRSRLDKNQPAMRPNLVIGKISTFSPRDGVVEGVVIVHNRDRARAVAIRLEGYNGRWRAKSVAVL
ncbi:MAG: 3-hydroxyacyl-CoA dehydrogenase [Rhodoluna sp.]|nr:3-hydroxyacyl-CoA dehydrogenase [Rhodoluna sp.]